MQNNKLILPEIYVKMVIQIFFFLLLRDAKETALDFSKGTIKYYDLFCFNIISV